MIPTKFAVKNSFFYGKLKFVNLELIVIPFDEEITAFIASITTEYFVLTTTHDLLVN